MKKINILCLILALTGLALAAFKILFFQFSLLPSGGGGMWLIQFRMTFSAKERPVKASLTVPAEIPGYITSLSGENKGFQERRKTGDGVHSISWSAEGLSGQQEIRSTMTLIPSLEKTPSAPPSNPAWAVWNTPSEERAAKKVMEKIGPRGEQPLEKYSRRLLKGLKNRDDRSVRLLLPDPAVGLLFCETAVKLFATERIPARIAEGVLLAGTKRRTPLLLRLEVFDGTGWLRFDPVTGNSDGTDRFVPLAFHGNSPVEASGVRNMKLTISVIRKPEPMAYEVNRMHGDAVWSARIAEWLGFTLPVEEQNMFKQLSMLPLAILFLVIVRNIVGVATMGTFMPVLIALAFAETGLVTGLVVFCIIMVLGLAVRRYLSGLNLLLVPRISAVVILVIILMKALGTVSAIAGFDPGASATFFPLIIIAWTIERASMIWEEDGPRATFHLLSASLCAAVPCYFLITESYLQYLFFSFPELNLVILAIVIRIGAYTGYRLTELRRFHSLVKK